MSHATVTGIVHVIEETKTYGQNGFRKRLLVLEQDNGRFTSHIPVEFIQDSCDTVDQLKIGDEVEVTYRLNGRKWQRDANSEVKYFLSAEAMGFNVINSGSNDAPADDADAPYGETFVSDEEPPF
ncbi:MAG: DUF3127 domain-containing protein [Fuerstiella sp.]|nr:DUF3127 domain-containing protein [Fuerstiella sp.]